MNINFKGSVVPEIPPEAEMVMGDNWSGWVWESHDMFGRQVFWFASREAGASGGTFRFFRNIHDLEQTMDIMDIPF